MVLLYMVTWIPSIHPLYVSIYTSTMDPMGHATFFKFSGTKNSDSQNHMCVCGRSCNSQRFVVCLVEEGSLSKYTQLGIH
jgi:hypothetical protein